MRKGRFTDLFLGILVVVAIGFVLYALRSVLLPFTAAVLLSYIFKPIVSRLNRRGVPTFISILVVLVLVSVILAGIGMLLYSTTESFIDALPRYERRVTALSNDIKESAQLFAGRWNIDLTQFGNLSAIDADTVTESIQALFSSFLIVFSSTVLVLLFLVFILAGTGQLAPKIAAAFPAERASAAYELIRNIDIQIREYLFQKTLISLVTGLIATVILLIFGVDFAILWGFLTFLLNFIPNIGSTVATIFPVAVSFLQFETVVTPIIVLSLLVSSQMLMGNVVEPRWMASRLDLSALVVLFSLILWAWLWGVWGMLMAVPITAALKIMFANIESLKPLAILMAGPAENLPEPPTKEELDAVVTEVHEGD